MAERRRYFLTRKGEQEREVSKESFVAAERGDGFNNTMGQPNEPATNNFTGKHYSGRTEYVRE